MAKPGRAAIDHLHSHDDNDELLSGVYYVAAPPGSGRLLIHAGGPPLVVAPEPGLFVFFSPELPHEVEVNASQGQRLSLAMNFGPLWTAVRLAVISFPYQESLA